LCRASRPDRWALQPSSDGAPRRGAPRGRRAVQRAGQRAGRLV